MAYKERTCKLSGVVWKQYNSFQKCTCSLCLESKPQPKKKPIKKVSDKRKELNIIYEKVRIEVLSEAKFKCFIDGCRNVANTVEHLMKRKGFADQWAKDNNIPLLIDKRYLRACCVWHNGELERNPELSKQYQYSNVSGKKKSEL